MVVVVLLLSSTSESKPMLVFEGEEVTRRLEVGRDFRQSFENLKFRLMIHDDS
jgi:hypothetical protein